jgi:hypothetical protein
MKGTFLTGAQFGDRSEGGLFPIILWGRLVVLGGEGRGGRVKGLQMVTLHYRGIGGDAGELSGMEGFILPWS